MKILIIENPRPLTFEHYNDVANAPLSASLNSGYALAVASRAGWDTAYLDFTSRTDQPESLAAAILAEGADIILLHWVYSWGHEETVRTLLDLLRFESTARLGAFGLFPTISRTRLFSYTPSLDFIMAGEFEDTLAELLDSFTSGCLEPIPGLALPGKPFVPRSLIDDLSLLPAPDDVGNNLGFRSLNIAASRGCYGDCSFCFIKPYYGCNRRRVRSSASLEQELKSRLTRRDVDSLYFIDPSFIAPGAGERERVIANSQVASSVALPFGFETRVDSIDEELIATLASNGARSAFLGIESGCDGVLHRIGKRVSREQNARAVRIIQGCGLKLDIGFIMFEPDTTLDEVAENYAFLEGLRLLNSPEQTINLLYHNQIMLYGSPAWLRFEQEQRLLVDPHLPFEAHYRFKYENAGRVCAAMGRLAAEYFKGMHVVRAAGCHAGSADNDVNMLLKEAFRCFVQYADRSTTNSFKNLEERFVQQLSETVASSSNGVSVP